MDIERHKRNVRKMIDGGANEHEIDSYLSGEGVTAEQLRGAPNKQKLPEDTPERRAQLQAGIEQGQAQSDAAQRKLDVINPVLGVANAVSRAGNAATLHLPDRMASTALAAKDAITGEEREQSRHDELKAKKETVRQQFPKSSLGADIGGAVLGINKAAGAGLTATKFVDGTAKGAKGLAATTGALAVDGAAYAGADALIDGRNAKEEAAAGGALGAAANVIFRGAGKTFEPLLKKVAESTTLQQLQTLRNTAYKRIDSIGARYDSTATGSLKQELGKELNAPSIGLDKALHPATSRIVKTLEDFKGDLPFQKLEQLRKRAQRVASNPTGGEDAYAASIVRDSIDDFIGRVDPISKAHSAESMKGLIGEARELHRRFKGSQAIGEASNKAGRREGVENATRQNIRQILDNPKRAKFFNEAEREAMEKLVKGSKGQNFLRLLGKAAPTGSVSTAISGGGGFALLGPAGAIGVPAAGHASRKASEKLTQRNIDDLIQLIRTGSAPRTDTTLSRAVGNEGNQQAAARVATAAGIGANR